MPFQYSAFISYRHRPTTFANDLIDRIYELLLSELEPLVPEPVFYDKVFFAGTPFSDDALAHALHKSVCMVMIYYPVYFQDEVTYSSREFKAMEELESLRIGHFILKIDRVIDHHHTY